MSQDARLRIQTLKELNALLEEKQQRKKYNFANEAFPDTGLLRRELYPKQLAFFKAGKSHKQRAMIAANRSGKSFAGGFELYLHLTGLYPDWWEGRRFDRHITAWAVGVTNEATKDVLQEIMIGSYVDTGTGMIPKELIVGKPVMRPGVPEAIQTVRIKHISGELSTLGFK